MLTKAHVQSAGVEYLILEASGGDRRTQYSLVLTPHETFDYVCDNPQHLGVILTIHGWEIPNDGNDAKYDVLHEYESTRQLEAIIRNEAWWDNVAQIAYDMGIDVDWEWAEDPNPLETNNEYEVVCAAIRTVLEWVEKPTYPDNSLESIQQRLCANWIERQARERISTANWPAKALEGYTALQPNYDHDHDQAFRTLINAAQEILKKIDPTLKPC